MIASYGAVNLAEGFEFEYGAGGVGGTEDGAAGHEHISACDDEGGGIVETYAAVYLDQGRAAERGAERGEFLNLGKGAGDESLTSEAGVDAH